MDRVIIKASDVSSILNLNNFKSREEVFNDLWKKYSPGNFNSKTKKDMAEEALTKSEGAQEVYKFASSFVSKSSDDAKEVYAKLEKKIKLDSKLDGEDKQKVLDHVRSKVYTNHGIQKETETAQRTSMNLQRDDKFYEIFIGSHNDRDYVVVGRIDRIEVLPDGSKVLVEIKNRVGRFYYKVYPRENVQIQVYLEMLDLEHAKLVEQLNERVNVLEVTRDTEMYKNEILPGLEEFCYELSCVIL
jgi:hypothetical protein